MSIAIINLAYARELLAQAVQTKGEDFVYNPGREFKCYYTPQPCGTNPSAVDTGCLVGVALTLGGIDVSSFGDVAITCVDNAGLTEEAADYLAWAQDAQDTGATWGQALREAETKYADGEMGFATGGIWDEEGEYA